MTREEATAEVFLLAFVFFAIGAMACCQAYEYREKGLTERAAIAARFSRDAFNQSWRPCETSKPAEAPK